MQTETTSLQNLKVYEVVFVNDWVILNKKECDAPTVAFKAIKFLNEGFVGVPASRILGIDKLINSVIIEVTGREFDKFSVFILNSEKGSCQFFYDQIDLKFFIK